MFPASRIVCLTEETVETLYLLGEQDRIVGVSGYVVRPPQARKEKPKVSAFTSANVDKILALQPDLVLAFSDIQADICHTLIKHGLNVLCFNQRTVAEILDVVRTVGALAGRPVEGAALADQLAANVADARAAAATLPRRPRVYFEEWDGPLISGIGWVSELVEAAGGIDIFPEKATGKAARERFVEPEDVIARAPDIIVGSWCGKRFRPEHVAARPGWADVPAVRGGEIHEIKSPLILQPGPAALTDGLAALRTIVHNWSCRVSESASRVPG